MAQTGPDLTGWAKICLVCRCLRCRCLLAAQQFLAIKLNEIDIFQVQRRETAIAGHIGYNAARKREQHAGAFDQQEGVQLLGRDVLNLENAAIFQFQQKDDVRL